LDLSDVHVLVVDDEPDGRETVAMVLTTHHAKVTTASSAREALARLVESPPDVLVSDIGMPEQDGYDLIREVRRLSRVEAAQVPAVALTAFAREEDRLQALAAGFQMHLAKPVAPADLVAGVAKLAGRVSGPASPNGNGSAGSRRIMAAAGEREA
jgi:CheY-like chemotaxis protein